MPKRCILQIGGDLLVLKRIRPNGEAIADESVSSSNLRAEPTLKSDVGRGKSQINSPGPINQDERAKNASEAASTAIPPNQQVESAKTQPAKLQDHNEAAGVRAAIAEAHVMDLSLSQIEITQGIQCRAAIDGPTVADYVDRMEDGQAFPPIVVFDIEGVYVLVDGFHRLLAAQRVGLKSFAVDVRQGNRIDAIKFAITANSAHGLRWNNEDKRHAVEVMLGECSQLSDRAIAEHCRVSQPFVGKIRKELQPNELTTVISSDLRIGRDGKRRKQRVLPIKTPEPDHPKTKQTNGTVGPSSNPEGESGAAIEKGKNLNCVDFWPDEEWKNFKILLNTHLAKWPAEYRTHLAENLHQFANSLS